MQIQKLSFIQQTFVFASVFMVFVIIGTLTHESGHWLAGRLQGMQCKISYASCACHSQEQKTALLLGKSLFDKFGSKDAIPKAEWEAYLELKKAIPRHSQMWVTMGGPLQTISTGFLGLWLICKRRKKNLAFETVDWLAVFLALFWSRESFNLLTSIAQRLISGEGAFFGGDEWNVSRRLALWEGTFSVGLGIIGFLICCFVVFKIVPTKVRLAFILGCLLGGTLGMLMWMEGIGPIMLP